MRYELDLEARACLRKTTRLRKWTFGGGLTARKYEKLGGIGRLSGLVHRKGLVAYSDARLNENQVKLIVVEAERFEVWANTAAKELKLEGWGASDD